jgi:hypothetical protein
MINLHGTNVNWEMLPDVDKFCYIEWGELTSVR